MDSGNPETTPAATAKAEKRTPRTIRFHDPEWARIEAFAEERGLSAAEFVRFAALAAVGDGPPAPGAADRLAPLIERTFRYGHVMATRMRGDMLAAGQGETLEALVRDARALQDELLGASED